MTTTLDGFIAGPNDKLDWVLSAPGQDLNDDIIALPRASDGGFLGYPVAQGMIPYWETVAADPSASPASRDLAAAVNRLRRIIISNQRPGAGFRPPGADRPPVLRPASAARRRYGGQHHARAWTRDHVRHQRSLVRDEQAAGH